MTDQKYYIGLDLGTSSIGWAVIDGNYKLIKKSGKHLWGVRLFDTANTALERRNFRRQRRTINKRYWRLFLLRQELKEFVLKEDPKFFDRLEKSKLKNKEYKYTLFEGDYTDVEYYREFPTIYHLRLSLQNEEKVKKYKSKNIYYRLLFLAINDILKNRGHFLLSDIKLDKSSSEKDIVLDFKELISKINSNQEDEIINVKEFEEIYKQYQLGEFNTKKSNPETVLLKAALGYKFNPFIFIDNENKEKVDIDFNKADFEKSIPDNDFIKTIINDLYMIYSKIKLNEIIGSFSTLSEAKVYLYNEHKNDLAKLKKELKELDEKLSTNYFDEIFGKDSKENKKPTYTNYVGKYLEGENKIRVLKSTSYDEFIKRLRKIKDEVHQKGFNEYLLDIDKQNYLFIPSGTLNRVVPYQLHLLELENILKVFKNVTDSDKKLEIEDHIKKILKFKVDYFVGPLSDYQNENYWVQKNPGFENVKITPYNYYEAINKQATSEQFIKKMLRKCTYLINEDCMQKDTILYQKYVFFNTINKIKINDTYLDQNQKNKLFDYTVKHKKSSLSKNDFVKALGINKNDDITGFSKDENKPLPLTLNAINKFNEIFPGFIDNPFYTTFFDEVINHINLIDIKEIETRKEKIRELLNSQQIVKADESQIDLLSKLTSSKWGNLSYKFLAGLKFADKNGELRTMIEHLENSNLNLMEILYAEEERNFNVIDVENGEKEFSFDSENLNQYLKDRYIAPQARRTIIQANKIIDEIVKIMGGVIPTHISIEFTRQEQEKKETDSRYQKLSKLYEKLKEEYNEVKAQLKSYEQKNTELKRKKVYLYFLQAGKDLYTGKPIKFEELLLDNGPYDIDHIIPRSKIKDDSYDNLVLTSKVINGDLGNTYPIPAYIQNDQKNLWDALKSSGLISNKKYERLTRSTPLTDDELNEFIARQKTTLDWINKEIAELFMKKFNKDRESGFIIYSKSQHISAIRNKFDLIKIRELNDFHHAHDAYLAIVSGLIINKKLNIYNPTLNWERLLEMNIKPIIDYIKQRFNDKDIFVTKKYEIKSTGPFWDQQIVKAGKGQESIKEGLDVKEYGGYNSAKLAFFSILKDKKDKKRFIPVRIFECANYIENGKVNVHKLLKDKYPNDDVIVEIVPINQLVEFGKIKMRVAGKSDNSVMYHNAVQFLLDSNYYGTLKKIMKIMNSKYKTDNDKLKVMSEINLKSIEIDEIFEVIKKHVLDLSVNKQKIDERLSRHFADGTENINSLFKTLSNLEKVKTIYNMTTLLLKANGSNEVKLHPSLPIHKVFRKTMNITYPLKLINESVTGFYTKTIEIHSV